MITAALFETVKTWKLPNYFPKEDWNVAKIYKTALMTKP